jgi:hypothetical protein
MSLFIFPMIRRPCFNCPSRVSSSIVRGMHGDGAPGLAVARPAHRATPALPTPTQPAGPPKRRTGPTTLTMPPRNPPARTGKQVNNARPRASQLSQLRTQATPTTRRRRDGTPTLVRFPS